MKILVMSDTHGNSLGQTVFQQMKDQVDMVLHLGDDARDLHPIQRMAPTMAMHSVGGAFEYRETQERIVEVPPNIKILMVHGHDQDVKSGLKSLVYYAQSKGVNVCLFGHTHQATTFSLDGIYFMNPGCLRANPGPVGNHFGILDISPSGDIAGEIHSC